MKKETVKTENVTLLSQNEQYESDKKAFAKLKIEIKKDGLSMRDKIQKFSFLALRMYVNSNRTNQGAVIEVMDTVNEQVKMIRAESVGYWFKEVGGLDVKFNRDTNSFSCRQNKENSKHGVNFSYDNMHLRQAADEKLAFYEIAPVEYKELKVPETLEKAFAGAIGNVAKMQSLGIVDDESLLTFLNGLVDKIHEKRADKATKEWIEKFQKQESAKVSEEKEIVETLPESV